jgi:excisionase family DNA binding protein
MASESRLDNVANNYRNLKSNITDLPHVAAKLVALRPHSLAELPSTERRPFETTRNKTMEKILSNSEMLLTTAAVAKWLGISTRAVCLWAECRELPAMKIGRQWRFRQDEMQEWLQRARAEKVKNYPSMGRAAAGV